MIQYLDAARLPWGIDALRSGAQDQVGVVDCTAAGALVPRPHLSLLGCP
ncbi:MAG: hypothetical protein OXF68_08305 [Gammaproteobacteria bacterium]|nr:hypothetical protein [Gammaproteobacteria bacterium]